MRRPPTRVWWIALLAVLPALSWGCGSGGRGTRMDQDRLTTEEIEASDFANAYDIVRTLRPGWLRTRQGSVNYPTDVVVYVDGTRLGGPDQLRTIPKLSIDRMRYYSPLEAQSRWGLNHTNGAIEVVTRRG